MEFGEGILEERLKSVASKSLQFCHKTDKH